MITRIWHGKTKSEDADDYLSFLQEKGVLDYLKTPGNLKVDIWRSVEGKEAHFWTVSCWENIEAVIAFAGESFDDAKYYPEDERFLLEFESKVVHLETFQVK